MKLDYSLETPEERAALVTEICAAAPPQQLTSKYLEILSDYVVTAADKAEHRKDKTILTDNRLITVNKRETSYQGLAEKFENGEDGLYNIMSGEDKNILFTPKISITEHDIETIPGLKELRDAIEKIEQEEKNATGRRKYLLKKQLIQMRQDQYVLKNDYQKPVYCLNIIKNFNYISFEDDITVDEEGNIIDNSIISFFNPAHISALLCNYSKLKEEAWGNFWSDAWYLMEDLDNLIEKTLRDSYPIYYNLLIYKIDGMKNVDIQDRLFSEFGVQHSVEYISSLWRKKIPKLLAEQAEKDYLNWYYLTQERGKFKKCSKCGSIKLAHNKFFSKNKTSKDGFYSLCKDCRNAKAKRDYRKGTN